MTKWVNEAGTPIGNNEIGYFEGTAEEAVQFLGALDAPQVRPHQIRVGLPCGPDCLRREGCLEYRSFYSF